jgi:hypothetical protein
MGNLNFKDYISQFEIAVGNAVLETGIAKPMQVSTRPGRFSYSQFARRMGKVIDHSTPFILDYYGYPKRSRGFGELLVDKHYKMPGRQIKSVKTLVVHFASVTIEDLVLIGANDYLKARFPEFKTTVLSWRGFTTNEEEQNKLAQGFSP